MQFNEKDVAVVEGFEVVDSTIADQSATRPRAESPLPDLGKLHIDPSIQVEEEAPLEVISSDTSSSETSSSESDSEDEVYIIKLQVPKKKDHGKHKGAHDHHRRSRGHSPTGWAGMKGVPFGPGPFGPWGRHGHKSKGHGHHRAHESHHPRHDRSEHRHGRCGRDKMPPPPPPFPGREEGPPPFPPHRTERGCPPGPPPFPHAGHPRGPPPPPPGPPRGPRGAPPPDSESETDFEDDLPPRGPLGHHSHHDYPFTARRGGRHPHYGPPPHFEMYGWPFGYGPFGQGAPGPRGEHDRSGPSPFTGFEHGGTRRGHGHHFGPPPPPFFHPAFGVGGGHRGGKGRGRHHAPFGRPHHIPFEDYEYYTVH